MCDTFTCATNQIVSGISGIGPIQIFKVINSRGNGHVFLVAGRDQNSDPTKPDKWGGNAVVVDQWYALQKSYPAEKYPLAQYPEVSAEYMPSEMAFNLTAGLGKIYLEWLTAAGNKTNLLLSMTEPPKAAQPGAVASPPPQPSSVAKEEKVGTNSPPQ